MKMLSKLALVLLLSPFALAAHTVTLNWVDTTPNLTGYNVYRGTTTGGPYTFVGTVPTIGYIDSSAAVQSEGTSYFYVVTAILNVESAYSNEAAAKIPYTAPPAPTGVTGTAK